ncbi:hypothetical protein HDU83_005370 [Entophlyctis luteolus]|nr:hypothetical protein HDU83_005370 [Entophlyctis luteolus]
MFGPNADYGTRKPPGTRAFSPAELAKYNGIDAAQPVYLALKGVVYDVSSARNMYSPGSGYSAFAGKTSRFCIACGAGGMKLCQIPAASDFNANISFNGQDASRALGMSSLKAEDCVADYSTLNAEQMETLDKWVAFYQKKYDIVGTVKL